jgi:hypothetical protein
LLVRHYRPQLLVSVGESRPRAVSASASVWPPHGDTSAGALSWSWVASACPGQCITAALQRLTLQALCFRLVGSARPLLVASPARPHLLQVCFECCHRLPHFVHLFCATLLTAALDFGRGVAPPRSQSLRLGVSGFGFGPSGCLSGTSALRAGIRTPGLRQSCQHQASQFCVSSSARLQLTDVRPTCGQAVFSAIAAIHSTCPCPGAISLLQVSALAAFQGLLHCAPAFGRHDFANPASTRNCTLCFKPCAPAAD